MTKKERYQHILQYFQEHMPVAETELFYDNPFQLLVAGLLYYLHNALISV